MAPLVDTASAGSFASLKLSPFIQETLDTVGFKSMTPVQASVLPLFMSQHKDVVVQAVTGSGKTLAFVIPLLEKLMRREEQLRDDQIGGIILCPTRELAIQTHRVVEQFIAAQAAAADENGSTSTDRILNPAMLLIGGNTTLKEDISTFKKIKPDILVGTPGRLEEFLTGSSSLTNGQGKGKPSTASLAPKAIRSICNVKELEMLILDEADRLLELGFTASITRVLSILPKQRRTGCFSATMSEGLGELCRVGLRNPVKIVVKVERKGRNSNKPLGTDADEPDRNTPATLQNTYLMAKARYKMATLLHLLQREVDSERGGSGQKVIVYFATCACIDYFYKILSPLAQLSQYEIYPLHGQQTPKKRTSTYNAFCGTPVSSKRPHQLLLCTDVAARGLDLPNVDLVVQFDPPQDPTQFNHRAGRTARAGASGKAVVMLTTEGREEDYVEFMKRRGVPLREEQSDELAYITDEQGEKINASLRKIVSKDRDLHDKGIRAYVSWVRSYSKHEASYIFSLKQYDLLGLAYTFGLLRLPKMPELKAIEGRDDWSAADIDWDKFAYLDKDKEAKRQSELEAERIKAATSTKKVEGRKESIHKGQSWSKQLDLKDRRELNKEKRARKRAYLKGQIKLLEEQAASNVSKAPKLDSGDGSSMGSDDQYDSDDLDGGAKRPKKRSKVGRTAGNGLEVTFEGL